MKGRLSILYFLQFAVWGCYLTSLGQFLGAGGLGKDIAWFYAAIGLVSVVMPALMGRVADRVVPSATLLGACHLVAGMAMLGAWVYASYNPSLSFGEFYPIYIVFLAFYMPTMALSNTTAFSLIKKEGMMPVDVFPFIRVWGTVGFVCAMWLVNSAYWHDGRLGFTLSETHPFSALRFQYNEMQLFCAGCVGLLAGLYSFTFPSGSVSCSPSKAPVFEIFRFSILKIFFCRDPQRDMNRSGLSRVGVFLIFVAFLGVCMQISNGYATPFISHFLGMEQYNGSFAAGNATMLFSISQISEAFVILLVGKSLKKWGISVVFGLGILAWGLRFLFLGIGNPEDGLIFLVLSMIVYGFAFNFITIAGHLHIEAVSPEGHKGLGQGVMMLMSNGIGATAGVIAAGAVINHWCRWEMIPSATGSMMRLFMGNWTTPWIIFTLYALLILAVWTFVRFSLKTSNPLSLKE